MGYSQPLRAIGQALEVLNIQSFEMQPMGDEFIVRGAVPAPSKRHWSVRFGADSEVPNFWNPLYDSREQESQIELRYSLQDIDLLEKEGRSRRSASEKPADASNLAQTLRCIGGYLQQKCARLLKVTRAFESVAVEYETSLGNPMKETFAVGDLYDLWVRMYLQRQGRTSDR